MPTSRRAFIGTCLFGQAAGVAAQAPADARLKARLTLTLARFTQWPASSFASATEPLFICVLHRNATLGEAFAELAGQTVAGHPVRVVANPDKGLAVCQVLFVHDSAERAGPGVPGEFALPMLTIGDTEGFSSRGGMVELVNVNDATRLDVNLKALRAAQLGLSSQVLKLARNIRE
jgi:hypothetical protein